MNEVEIITTALDYLAKVTEQLREARIYRANEYMAIAKAQGVATCIVCRHPDHRDGRCRFPRREDDGLCECAHAIIRKGESRKCSGCGHSIRKDHREGLCYHVDLDRQACACDRSERRVASQRAGGRS